MRGGTLCLAPRHRMDAIGDREGIGRARDAMSEFPTDGMGSDETREHCGLSVHIVPLILNDGKTHTGHSFYVYLPTYIVSSSLPSQNGK